MLKPVCFIRCGDAVETCFYKHLLNKSRFLFI